MDNDDRPVGRVLSRRETIALFGMSAVALLTAYGVRSVSAAQPQTVNSLNATTSANPSVTAAQASAASGCVVRPEMTEGPYFVDEKLNRSDIRTDPSDGTAREGVPLTLVFNVSQVGNNACAPLAGATIDVWHCNAQGSYSDEQSEGTAGKKFLRGYQTTDTSGAAQFVTIYPGWYQGRAVHIHFKIRTTTPDNQPYEFTSQLFFDDAFSDQIYTQAAYTRPQKRDTTNANDMIYQNGGDQMLLAPTPSDQGYTATFMIGLDLSDTAVGQPDGNTGPGGGPGMGGPGGPPPGGRPPGGMPRP